MVWSCYDWNAQMSGMSGMWVQSADVARCGSGMWPRGSRNLLLSPPSNFPAPLIYFFLNFGALPNFYITHYMTEAPKVPRG